MARLGFDSEFLSFFLCQIYHERIAKDLIKIMVGYLFKAYNREKIHFLRNVLKSD